MEYKYDDKVFYSSEIGNIAYFSDKDVINNPNISSEAVSERHKNAPLLITGIWASGTFNWQMIINPNYSVVQSSYYKDLPKDFVGFVYERNTNSGSLPDSDVNKDHLIPRADFYAFDDIGVNRKTLSGVISLRQAYHDSDEITPWNQFTFQNSEQFVSAAYMDGTFSSIADKSLPIYSTRAKNGWNRLQITFALLDNMIWMTDVGSSIEIKPEDFSAISISDFKNLSPDEMLEYFKIELKNTPEYCVSTNRSRNESAISIEFNDANQQVEVTVTTPRSYQPSFDEDENGEIIDRQWINHVGMSETISVSYSEFKNDNVSPLPPETPDPEPNPPTEPDEPVTPPDPEPVPPPTEPDEPELPPSTNPPTEENPPSQEPPAGSTPPDDDSSSGTSAPSSSKSGTSPFVWVGVAIGVTVFLIVLVVLIMYIRRKKFNGGPHNDGF